MLNDNSFRHLMIESLVNNQQETQPLEACLVYTVQVLKCFVSGYAVISGFSCGYEYFLTAYLLLRLNTSAEDGLLVFIITECWPNWSS